jgi:arylsulfatase A-like enzyme
VKEKLLVVSLDTYRRDNLGRVVDGVEVSPFLTGFARRSKLYDNYYASANWTIPSYASMFTGLPTVAHNFWGMKRFPGQPVELLFDEIALAGLKPALLCIGVLAEADIFKYRTDRYFATTYDPLKIDGTADLVENSLEQNDFVFFHTFLMHDYFYHYPYRSADGRPERRYLLVGREASEAMAVKMRVWLKEHYPMSREDLRMLERMYYNECLVVDSFCERLVTRVLNRFPHCRIIVNSDHGECFNHCGKAAFDGNWARTSAPLWHHSSGFCPEQFEVFAIEHGPGVRAGAVDHRLMDHEDIYRMILERLGLPVGPAEVKTYNLISSCYDRVGYCGVLDRGRVYLYDRNRDLAFLLAEEMYSRAVLTPCDRDVQAYRRLVLDRARDLPAYGQAEEAVLTRLQGFGYL